MQALPRIDPTRAKKQVAIAAIEKPGFFQFDPRPDLHHLGRQDASTGKSNAVARTRRPIVHWTTSANDFGLFAPAIFWKSQGEPVQGEAARLLNSPVDTYRV